MKSAFPVLFTIITIGLFYTGLNAQPFMGSPHNNGKHPHWLNTFMDVNRIHATAAKGTGIGSRLIADVHGNFDASNHWLPDSTVYHYSGGHGGDYENLVTPYPLKYDSSVSWTTDAATLTYKLSRRQTQSFNQQFDLLAVQTTQQWSGTAWLNNTRTIISYNAAAQIDTILYQSYNTGTGTWVNSSRNTFTFNTGGIRIATTYDVWSTSTNTFQTQIAYQYTLDGSNNVIMELELAYDNVTMMLKPGFRVFHHYNTSNIETGYAFQQASGSTWVNTDSTAMILNGANMVTEYLYYTWNTASATWLRTSHLLETYTATGKIWHELDQNWNSTTGIYTNADSTYRTYNANDQLQTYHYFSFVAGISDAETHYYYEQYTTSGVGNAPQSPFQGDVLVYPVPADGILHVYVRLSTPSPLNCIMYDAMGKVVRSWREDATVAHDKDLSLTNVAAGTYWLRASTPDAVIVKAFVVEHTH